jgi:hypothetical protein
MEILLLQRAGVNTQLKNDFLKLEKRFKRKAVFTKMLDLRAGDCLASLHLLLNASNDFRANTWREGPKQATTGRH